MNSLKFFLWLILAFALNIQIALAYNFLPIGLESNTKSLRKMHYFIPDNLPDYSDFMRRTSLTVSNQDGSILMSGFPDGTIQLRRASDLVLILSISAHNGPISSACFSADGTKILSSSSDRRVKLWDANSGALIYDLHTNNHEINASYFNLRNNKIICEYKNQAGAYIWVLPSTELLNPKDPNNKLYINLIKTFMSLKLPDNNNQKNYNNFINYLYSVSCQDDQDILLVKEFDDTHFKNLDLASQSYLRVLLDRPNSLLAPKD